MEVISTIDEGRPGGGLFRFVGSGFQLALGNVRWLTTRKFVVLVCCSTEASLVTVVKPLHTLWCCVLLFVDITHQHSTHNQHIAHISRTVLSTSVVVSVLIVSQRSCSSSGRTVLHGLHAYLWLKKKSTFTLVPCSITSPLEGRPRRDNEVLDERAVGVRGQPEPTATPSSCGATTMTAVSEVCLGGDLARQSFFEVVSSGISLMARLHFGRWTT